MSWMSESALGLIEFYLGDLIEDLITRYRYPVSEDEYDDLLRYIYKALVTGLFKGRRPDPDELESKLEDLRTREKAKLEIVLSYLISKYVSGSPMAFER